MPNSVIARKNLIFFQYLYSFIIMTAKAYEYYLKVLDDYLKKRRLRSSVPRNKLLQFLCDPNNGLMSHFEADTVAMILHEKDIGVSRASVFRNLTLFSEAGILRKSKFGENHFHYELIGTAKRSHHHLICKKCGTCIEFEKSSLKSLAEKTAKD
ncbi:MAG: transcriptional repressor, partial [Candidatus Delongbacteria bacterium]|nr:transcriptional repressor [Candidatus Delongbacteria bacterium]